MGPWRGHVAFVIQSNLMCHDSMTTSISEFFYFANDSSILLSKTKMISFFLFSLGLSMNSRDTIVAIPSQRRNSFAPFRPPGPQQTRARQDIRGKPGIKRQNRPRKLKSGQWRENRFFLFFIFFWYLYNPFRDLLRGRSSRHIQGWIREKGSRESLRCDGLVKTLVTFILFNFFGLLYRCTVSAEIRNQTVNSRFFWATLS